MKLKSFCVNCDVFSCLFPLNVQSWMQLLSRVVCACQSRKSDFGWHHLAWCVKELKSLKRSWPYLAAFRSCISNGKPEQLLYLMFVLFHCCCCCFFFSNFMKQVERSLCGYFIHVCKIIRNDLISYQVWYNHKLYKQAFRHFPTANRKETFRRILSCNIEKECFERFSRLEFILKKANTGNLA